jgi:hypothetical protein
VSPQADKRQHPEGARVLALAFVGTRVLTTALGTANELGHTRARQGVGYLPHLPAGEAFALIQYAVFAAILGGFTSDSPGSK